MSSPNASMKWVQSAGAVSLLWVIAIATAAKAAPLPGAVPSRVISWNVCSRQFIDAPTFRLLPLPGTATYRARIVQGGKSWTAQSSTPIVSLAPVWPELAVRKFDLVFEWVDAAGKVIASDPATTRVKAPDFAADRGADTADVQTEHADWRTAAARGAAYLLHVGSDGKPPYREPGVPTWIWSAYGNDPSAPAGADVGYPSLFIPMLIDGLVAHASASGGQPAEQAMAQARAAADWALRHRQPDGGALPLFPFSTIAHGHFSGGVEGQSVNLLRAAFFAAGLVHLYEADGRTHPQYLEYARHIARVTMKFQAADGSFPYRLNPTTGAVVEAYTPAAIQFVRLVDVLTPFGVDDQMLKSQQGALHWTTTYVIAAHHWQACYEDVPQFAPYANLSQWDAQTTIQCLCRHRNEDPTYLRTAESLNRWIEDQFVVFGPADEAADHPVKGPLVFEQFACWAPMEVHTGRWIDSLLDLHAATGKSVYLQKAQAAGDAICAQQFADGSFSTFGARRWPDGKAAGTTPAAWYNCNATAIQALYRLAEDGAAAPRIAPNPSQ